MEKLSQELNDYEIFFDKKTDQFYGIESKVWNDKYRYDDRRFSNDEQLLVELEEIIFDVARNEYVKTGNKNIVKHSNLGSVMIKYVR